MIKNTRSNYRLNKTCELEEEFFEDEELNNRCMNFNHCNNSNLG